MTRKLAQRNGCSSMLILMSMLEWMLEETCWYRWAHPRLPQILKHVATPLPSTINLSNSSNTGLHLKRKTSQDPLMVWKYFTKIEGCSLSYPKVRCKNYTRFIIVTQKNMEHQICCIMFVFVSQILVKLDPWIIKL